VIGRVCLLVRILRQLTAPAFDAAINNASLTHPVRIKACVCAESTQF